MTTNQKRKIKRQAHKDFRKQMIRAYRRLSESSDELTLIRLVNTGTKTLKHVHYSWQLRVNRLYKKAQEFGETASRPYDEFFG